MTTQIWCSGSLLILLFTALTIVAWALLCNYHDQVEINQRLGDKSSRLELFMNKIYEKITGED